MIYQPVNKVAVLLAAYNGSDYIEEQLISILNQSLSVDIFINVDQSKDNTYEICLDYSEVYSNVHILPYGKRYGGAASNFFCLIRNVDLSKYDFVALSDQDDIWFDYKIKRAVDIMKNTNAKGYSSNVLAFWENGKRELIDKSQPQRKYDYLFEAAGPGCTYVMSSDVLQKFKCCLIKNDEFYDFIELHDWLIYAFFRRYDHQWYIDRKPCMLYRQHANNQVGINKGLNAIVKRFFLLKDGWYKKQVELVSKFIQEEECNKVFISRKKLVLNSCQTRRKFLDRVILVLISILGLV